MLAAYPGAGYGLDFEEFHGLWLNLDRAQTRQVVQLARGSWFAQDDRDLTRDEADAVAHVPEQTDELLFKANSERQVLRIKQQRGW